MRYSAADEVFTHQLPQPFDQVHHPDPTWSDRCYFFAASPDGTVLLASGYGDNPNTQSGLGYAKVTLADGRHWDLMAGRPVTGSDRAELSAGPMRWTCVEPLKRWKLEIGPNDSGIEWELYYEPTAPMWELLPVKFEGRDGKLLADLYHMKEPGRWTGWVDVEGRRISVDGFHGGRDRTFGLRVADEIDFWLWLDAGFDDRAIEAWIFESSDGTVKYVDGGITHADGTLSKRFVKLEHDVEFDGDRKRPSRAVLVFTDEDGKTYRVTADAPHQDVNVYYAYRCRPAVTAIWAAAPISSISGGTATIRAAPAGRGEVDVDGPADALRVRRRHRLGNLRAAARRGRLPEVPQLASHGHVRVPAGRLTGRPIGGRRCVKS